MRGATREPALVHAESLGKTEKLRGNGNLARMM